MSIRYGSFLRSTVTAFAISSVRTLLLCSAAWRRLEMRGRRPHANNLTDAWLSRSRVATIEFGEKLEKFGNGYVRSIQVLELIGAP
jgi:hypothetical protein